MEGTSSRRRSEMERFDHCAGEKDQGAITLVLDLAEAIERVGFPDLWRGRRISKFPMSTGFFVG